MKKRIVCGIISALFLTLPASAQTDKEILFRNVPWGTNYEDTKAMIPELDLYPMHSEGMDQAPIIDVISKDKSYILKEFKNTHINIISHPFSNREIEVAGYTTSNVSLYFAFSIDGDTLPQDTEHSKLYGARYEFEPVDLQSASSDLKDKLSSLYGDPDDEKSSTDFSKTSRTSIYWNGANNTQVVLTSFDSSQSPYSFAKDEIYISYLTTDGDKWLHEADDFLSDKLLEEENAQAGNGNTDGL